MALFRAKALWVFCLAFLAGAHRLFAVSDLDRLPALTNVAGIKHLDRSALARRIEVDLTGVITYYDPTVPVCFIQDATGGISVAAGGEDRPLQPGQLCRITGTTGIDVTGPCVESPIFILKQATELPKAGVSSILDLRRADTAGAWVAVEGTVRTVFESKGRLVYRVNVADAHVNVVVNSLARDPDRFCIGRKIHAEGVALSNSQAGLGTSLQLLAPFERCIRLEEDENAPPLPITLARRVRSMAPSLPVRVRLRVNALQSGFGIEGEDITGALKVFSTQWIPLAPGAMIDVTGFVAERNGAIVLEDCSVSRVGFIPLSSPLPGKNTDLSLPILHSAVEVRRLSGDEAARGYPVRLRGVITYYDAFWKMLFFQGSTEGIFVKVEDQDLDLKPGQLVQLEGVTGTGDYAPVVEKPTFEVLSAAPMPTPKPVTFPQMANGVEDSQWIKTEGIITAVSRQGPLVKFDIAPPTGNGAFVAYLPRLRERTPLELRGTRVEIEAACATIFNSRRELRGIQLFVPELRFIRVLQASVEDRFASDALPIANLLQFSPDHRTNQLVHVRGEVTHLSRTRLYLEDQTGGVLVLPDEDFERIRLGQTVDVVGFPREVNGATTLDRARLKRTISSFDIRPRPIRPENALVPDSDLDSRLVEIEALLIENGRSSEALSLLLESDNHLFNAVAPLAIARQVRSLSPGSKLRLQGVCSLQRDEHGQTLGFRVLLRKVEDITVLVAPSFWSVRHLVIAASFLALATIAILVWVITLRSRVRKQTAVIRKHLEAQSFLHERFVEFTRHFPGIAFIKNEDGAYVFANPAFLELAGKSEAEVLGTTDDLLWPPSIALRQKELDRDLLHGKGRLDVNDHFDLEQKRAWLATRFLINADTSGKRFLCGVGVDVTEQRDLEEKLLQIQKMECVGRLAGGVAHDFNNILQVISSYAELIHVAPHESTTREYSEEIFNAAARAADLTRQLLMFSRKQVMQKGTLDLGEVSQAMVKMLARIVGEDIALDLQLSAVPCLVNADRGMLEQILLNLAVNARDAMPKGGCLRIETAIRHVGEKDARVHHLNPQQPFVTLKVADTGSGIKPEHLANIFEPFFTTKEVGRGTGLGLATVYAIIQEHNGWITVESKLGSGTSFEIFLPQAENADVLSRPSVSTVAQAGGTETILLVEDDQTVRKLSARILTQHGYHVLEAESGPAALDIARQKNLKLDLAITDMVMPGGLRGIELCEPLNAVFPSLPIIITSGYAFEAAEKLSHLNPHTTFLQKPFLPEELLSMVRSALSGRPSAAPLFSRGSE